MSSFTIGSDPACDIYVDDEYVSKRHARVWRDGDGQVWVEDLGSTNGTFLNGERIRRPTRMGRPCSLKVGHTFLPWTR